MKLLSHQESVEKSLLNLTEYLSSKFHEYLFVICLRSKNNTINKINCDNVMISNKHDIYDVAKKCDLHISIYSTFILESLFLGVPNIIFDYNGIGRNYLSDILQDSCNINFCKSNKDIEKIIKKWPFETKTQIKKHFSYLFENQSRTIIEKEFI